MCVKFKMGQDIWKYNNDFVVLSFCSQGSNILASLIEYLVTLLVLFFVISIVNAMAQAYHRRIHGAKVKKQRRKQRLQFLALPFKLSVTLGEIFFFFQLIKVSMMSDFPCQSSPRGDFVEFKNSPIKFYKWILRCGTDYLKK